MDSPDYMSYETGSTTLKQGKMSEIITLPDQESVSSLAMGHLIPNLPAGETFRFESKYKVNVPDAVLDDPLYTVAVGALVGPYSDLPVMSNPINTTISGHPLGSLNVAVQSFPPEGQPVFSGSSIDYHYTLTNAGGEPIEKINLITHLPEGTQCLENCGTNLFSDPLEPGKSIEMIMKVQVKVGQQDLEKITNIGFDISTESLQLTEIKKPIIHPLNAEIEMGTGVFTLLTEQVPNLVLNSPHGKPRPDQGDMTETQYVIKYTGRGKYNTYTVGGGYGIQDSGNKKYHGYCSDHSYPHGKNSTVFAYNSTGGGCEDMNQCSLQSNALQFLLNTQLPKKRPRLILKEETDFKSEIYSYGDTGSVNYFMKNGGVIKAPKNFTLSRAIQDGTVGKVDSTAQSQNILEDLWSYAYAGFDKVYDHCSCGDDCEHTDSYPVYTWQKIASTPIDLKDEDTTNISVYSSTAWLKTEGGHLGTNGAIINNQTEANEVNLTFGGGDYMEKNNYVHEPDRILTPSNKYTPFGETNVDYMLFSGKVNEAFNSKSGDRWVATGVNFDYLEQGEAYDRKNNPRDFREDLLVREKFGPVLKDQLPTTLTGTVNIKDNVVWYQSGDLILGKKGVEDKVIFSGGQARFYVEGDVYINANVFYDMSKSNLQNNITSLRIEARNIYIEGEVEDLELLILARENFYSGESHRQLRILGDVIAKSAHWERKPLLQIDPEDINKPSEHIIEDYRKYVLPVPGDTELPDEYNVWRQVNAGSGAQLNSY